MNRLIAFYMNQPDVLRKAERDFVAAFIAALLATGALNQATPNYHTLWQSVVASAGIAGWRIVRQFTTQGGT